MAAIARIPVFLALGVSAWLAAQTGGRIGAFEDRADVGNPALKGTAEFDAAKGEYRLTGAGANIWANGDQFCYVWRKVSGNVRMEATVRFLGAGKEAHRKAGLMLRKSLEGGSPYVDVVVHGSGLTSLQFRETDDQVTREFQFPVNAATRLAIEHQGNLYTIWLAKEGGPLEKAGSMEGRINEDVYAGLFICSHNADTMETAVFSDVKVEPLTAPSGSKK
jgi:TolB protein